jgi:Protein of unknown function (DUF2380)
LPYPQQTWPARAVRGKGLPLLAKFLAHCAWVVTRAAKCRCWFNGALPTYHEAMKRPILRGFCGALAILIAGSALAAAAPDKPKLVVVDIELTGDLGGPKFTEEHEARLRMESDTLRHELGQSGLYTVVDSTPAQPLITKLKSQQSYLHDCNGCDLEIGRQLGANQVLVTWVDRVSGLILSLTYEFHDVSTGQIVGRKSYDFRGDNDSAWTHAVKYMVRDLKETAAAPATAAN